MPLYVFGSSDAAAAASFGGSPVCARLSDRRTAGLGRGGGIGGVNGGAFLSKDGVEGEMSCSCK